MSMLSEDEQGNFIEVGYTSPFTGECDPRRRKQQPPRNKKMTNSADDMIIGMAIKMGELIKETEMLRHVMIESKNNTEYEFKLLHKRIDKLNES